MENKIKYMGFSIVTNFGCDNNCYYCIWKKHPLYKNDEKTDFEKLDKIISKYEGYKINISGGGDPLYNYNNNILWWTKVYDICIKYNKLYDVHTRIFEGHDFLINTVNKIVLSFDNLEKSKPIIEAYLKLNKKVRLTKVIQKNTTEKELYNVDKYSIENNCEITFKKMSHCEDNLKYEFFKENYFKNILKLENPNILFLDDGNYNIYYMPDNTIQTRYIDKN